MPGEGRMTPELDEIWRPVDGFGGLYQVSNLGGVRSLDRIIRRKDGSVENKKGRVLKQSMSGKGYATGKGYLFVPLCYEGKRKLMYVHRLVALAFLTPSDAPHVNHIDLNKTNNAASNLEWVTPKENIRHAVDMGQFAIAHQGGMTLAVNNPNRRKKLTPEAVDDIRKACARGERQADIGARFGITQAIVSKIHRGQIWASTPRIKCDRKTA
jgi:hypothetical protein